MTTIVFRDGVMATDSAVNSAEVMVGTVRKIISVGDLGFLALSGLPSFKSVAVWLEKWPGVGEVPKCVEQSDVVGLFAIKSGKLLQIDGGVPYEMAAPFFAEGSGKLIALGALAMGATAEQAVDIAIRYDNGSGGPTQTVKVF